MAIGSTSETSETFKFLGENQLNIRVVLFAGPCKSYRFHLT